VGSAMIVRLGPDWYMSSSVQTISVHKIVCTEIVLADFGTSLNLFSVKFTYTRSLVPLFSVKGYRSLYRVRVSFH